MQKHWAIATAVLWACSLGAAERGRVGVYEVVELAAPSADPVRFRHASGSEYRIYPFDDGGAWRVRFCPTATGRWAIAGTSDYVTAVAAKGHGFWVVDPESPGRRWYRRSDGSRQYIVGNTMYGLMSRDPAGITSDVRANGEYFRKLRFSAIGDLHPDPSTGPFLDGDGNATYDGAWSHRPNPRWFRERVDTAVRTAWEADTIADLILSGVDTVTARSALSPARNGGDPEPFLRYLAARYGAYPNVWMCLINEYDIRSPKYTADDIQRFGAILRKYLPYSTPVSVHRNAGPWLPELNSTPWNDHAIIQNKLKTIAEAADAIDAAWRAAGADKPVIDDELSYQGEGDRHTEMDTVESHLGAFLGGGYGTTGHKSGNKLGQYFTGRFTADEHTAARGLKWMREAIDRSISFWRMQPGASIFPALDPAFRAMGWEGREYVLGTDRATTVRVELPAGAWRIVLYDIAARQDEVLQERASGRIELGTPESRAVLFHISRLK
jgi:hypothetical protein